MGKPSAALKPEEVSTLGLMLLLFGITWIAVAWSQPIATPPSPCSDNTAGLPKCNALLTPVAQLFYTLGVPAVLFGGVMLFLRWYAFTYQQSTEQTAMTPAQSTELLGGPTPASFLKKCPNCGRELPIAAEKCYSCGANV